MTGRRNIAIDCLRGFSIITVMAVHGLFPPVLFPFLTYDQVIRTESNGYYGVAMFFVISGFLITSNTLRRYGSADRIDFGQFCAMRVARIGPCLLIALSALVALYLFRIPGFVPDDPRVIWNGVYSAITLQFNNFYLAGGNVPGNYAMSPLWSLSIEEMFYLIFPIACFLLRREWLLVVVLACLLPIGLWSRSSAYAVYGWWSNADLLAIGCLAALVEARVLPRSTKGWPALAMRAIGITTIIAVFSYARLQDNFRFGTLFVGAGAALFLLGASRPGLNGPLPQALAWPCSALAIIGRVSYELYVFHIMFRLIAGWLKGVDYPAGTLSISASLALLIALCAFAVALSRYCNEPLNRAIRGFYASSRGDMASISAPRALPIAAE